MTTVNNLLHLIVYIMVSSGGVGKTFIAQLIEAVARLQNIDIVVASQDRGSHSLPEILDDVKIIGSNPGYGLADDIVKKYRSHKIILIDVGANPESETHNPLRFAYKLNENMRDIGGRLIGVSPTGSLKLKGLKTAVKNANNMKTHLALNQMNTSTEFGKAELNPDIPVSRLPYLQTGFLEYSMEHKGSLADLITSPPPGYELAAHHFSAFLMQICQTALFQDIFNFGTEGLVIPGFERPPSTIRPVAIRFHATNEMLELNYSLRREHQAMIDVQRTDADRLYHLNKYCQLIREEDALKRANTDA